MRGYNERTDETSEDSILKDTLNTTCFKNGTSIVINSYKKQYKTIYFTLKKVYLLIFHRLHFQAENVAPSLRLNFLLLKIKKSLKNVFEYFVAVTF